MSWTNWYQLLKCKTKWWLNAQVRWCLHKGQQIQFSKCLLPWELFHRLHPFYFLLVRYIYPDRCLLPKCSISTSKRDPYWWRIDGLEPCPPLCVVQLQSRWLWLRSDSDASFQSLYLLSGWSWGKGKCIARFHGLARCYFDVTDIYSASHVYVVLL